MWFNLLLIMILTVCVITDIRSRKIYNKIIYPSLLVTFLSHLLQGGWDQLLGAILGFSLGFFLLLIPYLMGGMGAGDVKLLALIGALKGSSFVLYTGIYMALIGGAIALILLIHHKKLLQFLKQMPYLLTSIRLLGTDATMTQESSICTITYPYGIAIAGGAVFTLLLQGRLLLW
ncbi:A24 family peptidase [Anaerosolibacter sp.]|uniref:A24 family peptidase n=1 Tax=Anaerosolibacter sp. TaxID=1872527 RepID=UPI0039F02D9A